MHAHIRIRTGPGNWAGNIARFLIALLLGLSVRCFAAGMQFEFAKYSVSEEAGFVLIGVTRGADTNGPASVDYATSDGTAVAGTSYVTTNGTLNFAAGQTVQLFQVSVLNEGLRLGSKYFRVTLSNPVGTTLGSQRSVAVTILDNDPGVSFELARFWARESDTQLSVTVLRGNDVQLGPFTVDYVASDGSAQSGVDYGPTGGTLAFAQGEQLKTLTIPILYRSGEQGDRKFTLTLTNLQGDAILGGTVKTVVTILDTEGMVPHRIDKIQVTTGPTVRLSFSGSVSKRFKDYYDLYPVEVSTDLVHWTPLLTLQRTNVSTNSLTYAEPMPASSSMRFYRTPTNHLITPFSVQPSGPYAVGVRSRMLTDPTRRNRYDISTNGSFMVSIWYPALAQAGQLPAPLLDAQIAADPRFSEELHGLGYPAASFVDRSPAFVEYGLREATFAPDTGLCSILVATPEGYGWRASLAEKAANLASHGYVVVVSDPCDTPATVTANGLYIMQPHSTIPGFVTYMPDRIRDLTFMVDELARWNANDPVFAGRLNLQRIASMGTCCGFNSAAEFCRSDARCKAAVLVSCTPGRWPCTYETSTFPELDKSGPGKPSLVVFGDYSDAFRYYDYIYNHTAEDSIVFQVKGVGDAGYGAMILVQDFYLALEPYRLAQGRDGARIIADYSLWFLNKYLRGSTDPMPAPTDYPRIMGFKQK